LEIPCHRPKLVRQKFDFLRRGKSTERKRYEVED